MIATNFLKFGKKLAHQQTIGAILFLSSDKLHPFLDMLLLHEQAVFTESLGEELGLCLSFFLSKPPSLSTSFYKSLHNLLLLFRFF